MAMKTSHIVIALIAVVLIFNIGGLGDKVWGLLPSGADGAPSTPTERCYVEDTTLMVGPAQEMFNPGNKLTTEYHQVFVNGINEGAKLDGSTMTVTPGDEICIVYGINSSATPGTGFYANKQCFTVPCDGRISTASRQDSDAYKLCQIDANGMTVRFFNEDNGNLNAVTDNETLGAGDVINMEMTYQGTYEDCFSPYGDMVAVVSANTTNYDEIKIGSYPAANSPKLHKSVEFGVDEIHWAYSLPGVKSNEKVETTLTVDVDDSTNPGTTNDAIINVTLYDQDYFINDMGEIDIGVENSTYKDVGGTNPAYEIYVK